MNKLEELLERAVLTAPLSLLSIKDPIALDYINNMLPFSTGFEIECRQKDTYNINNFRNIPDIMAVNVDSGEQRYRIPNGLRGIICLYNISQQLNLNSELNPLSGIHYHVDMTKTFGSINNKFIEDNREWILKELESWEYDGNFNSKGIGYGHYWVRLSQEHKTSEFRIGEMTFDYQLLIKRIVHCNSIVKKMNINLGYNIQCNYKEINRTQILEYINDVSIFDGINELETLRQSLKDLKTEEVKLDVDNIYSSIQNRTIKINSNGTAIIKKSL